MAAFGADYATLLQGIRSRAAAARIVVLNVPNLAALPFLAGAPLAQRQAAQRAAVGMTTVVNALTAQAVTVVDLMCNERSYQTSSYSSDGFHPNDAGYAFIAAEVVLAATNAAYPPPRAQLPADERGSAAVKFETALERLRIGLAQPLPGAEAQALMAPHPRRNWPPEFDPVRVRHAAGLLLLFPIGADAHIVLTVRADTLGRHGGQVSLPGGVAEPGNRSSAPRCAKRTRKWRWRPITCACSAR